MLTQSDKEELWGRGYYETIIEHDIGWIRKSVDLLAGGWADKDTMYSLAYEYCARACPKWNNTSTFCTLWRGCARNAVRNTLRIEARYKRAVDGDWYSGKDVVDRSYWRFEDERAAVLVRFLFAYYSA